ncbi:MAG: hypothetical protein QGG36_03915 [Pirellulaceae bacterium]|jgi:hypothetical protein|nr:hypothetical protein [Pirellulaceae bacterium]MDP7014926.1 hypothetical protein [Pirellulaceae bacterium]
MLRAWILFLLLYFVTAGVFLALQFVPRTGWGDASLGLVDTNVDYGWPVTYRHTYQVVEEVSGVVHSTGGVSAAQPLALDVALGLLISLPIAFAVGRIIVARRIHIADNFGIALAVALTIVCWPLIPRWSDMLGVQAHTAAPISIEIPGAIYLTLFFFSVWYSLLCWRRAARGGEDS